MSTKDKAAYNRYMKEYMLKRYHTRRAEAIQKLGGSCQCGVTNDLQFDHIDRNTKSFTIAKLSSVNDKAFWEEISKCQLLCHECHQKKTLTDLGQVSAKTTHGTLSSYRYCRCQTCVKFKSQYTAEHRKERKTKLKCNVDHANGGVTQLV